MNLSYFGIHFSDIIISFISALVLASISFILFYIFKSSHEKSFTDFQNNHPLTSIKKKGKKKINLQKIAKNVELPVVVNDEQHIEIKHIEINTCPEILNDDLSNETVFVSLSPPGKPILRRTDEKILINKEECEETVWAKIPKDEVEILRSRHSSVVSELRLEYKDDDLTVTSKMSRGQKKKLRAKLKMCDIKSKETKNDIQSNNSASIDFNNEAFDNTTENPINDSIANKLNLTENNRKSRQPKNNSMTSSDSSQVSDKHQSMDTNEKFLINDFIGNLLSGGHGEDINGNASNFNCHSFVDNFSNSEEKKKLENEIKNLTEERYTFLQKINELHSMTANVMSLKKENEMLLKKNDDLERTCNSMKKEITSTVQKNSSIEGQFMRFKAEKSQQLVFYENEINKFNNKVNVLENDIRAKVVEQEHLGGDIEKLHHVVSDKDKHIQNQNIEMSSLKEQLYKKRIDCQDLEAQIKGHNLKLKDMESQKQLAHAEIQKLNAQVDSLKQEICSVQKQMEQLKRQSKAQEQQQDAIISSLQYKLDEFLREKQQCQLSPANNDKISQFQVQNKQTNTSNANQADINVPDGFQLIESNTIKKFTAVINEGNQRLQEKCDQFNSVIDEYKDKEANLLEENSLLNEKYCKLNSEFKSHLDEIVHLRKCIETLQQELSKNSETTLEDMKLELDDKCETLRKTEAILSKLETSVDEEESKWRGSLNESKQENLRLQNELKNQASLIDNQNKQISDLSKLLQTSNNSQNETIFNGTLSGGSSETSN